MRWPIGWPSWPTARRRGGHARALLHQLPGGPHPALPVPDPLTPKQERIIIPLESCDPLPLDVSWLSSAPPRCSSPPAATTTKAVTTPPPLHPPRSPIGRSPSGLVADGTITVCSDTPYEPFEMKDDDGTDAGFDMDLVAAIGTHADLDLAVIDLPFDGILVFLAAGQCDVVASAVTRSPTSGPSRSTSRIPTSTPSSPCSSRRTTRRSRASPTSTARPWACRPAPPARRTPTRRRGRHDHLVRGQRRPTHGPGVGQYRPRSCRTCP